MALRNFKMTQISLALVMSLLTLYGCADKNEHSDTQASATNDKANTANAPADSPTVADTSTTSIATETNTTPMPIEEENPPRFATVTDYIALKPNETWQWETLAKAPDIKEWHNQKPARNEYLPEDPTYSISGSLDDYGALQAYGTQSQPNVILIGSGQGVADDETGSAVYQLHDLFRAKELTRITSNCDKNAEEDMITQHFYKWQKEGYQPLYIFELNMPANAGTSSEFGIAKSFEEFFKPEYDNAIMSLDNTDKAFNEITCTFEGV